MDWSSMVAGWCILRFRLSEEVIWLHLLLTMLHGHVYFIVRGRDFAHRCIMLRDHNVILTPLAKLSTYGLFVEYKHLSS